MIIIWHDSYTIGIDSLDAQHKTLFSALDQLVEATQKNQSKAALQAIFNFLLEYTETHFGEEEELMRSCNYPGYEAQKKAHAIFIESICNLRHEFCDGGHSLFLIAELHRKLVDWLIDHVTHSDLKIAIYLNQQQHPES